MHTATRGSRRNWKAVATPTACGTCDASCEFAQAGGDCADGTGCASDGDCTNDCNAATGQCYDPADCGDAAAQVGEFCDDANALDCGTCNATCEGVGTGATGTSLLALLAKHVAPERKPAAAALVWFMMTNSVTTMAKTDTVAVTVIRRSGE